MKKSARVLFCSYETDALGVKVLEVLQVKGCEVKVLSSEEEAPPLAVAVFTLEKSDFNWPGRNIRLAAHRLLGLAPNWASPTPFLAGVRYNLNGNLEKAALHLGRRYEIWFTRGAQGQPWNAPPTGEDNKEPMRLWLDKVGQVNPWQFIWVPTPGL